MLQPPVPMSEINRTLAAYFERGDLDVIQSVNTTTYGYILALKKAQANNAVQTTD